MAGKEMSYLTAFIAGFLFHEFAMNFLRIWREYLATKLDMSEQAKAIEKSRKNLQHKLKDFGIKPLSEFRDPAEVLKMVKKEEPGGSDSELSNEKGSSHGTEKE
jgi:hypothetical protein